jgi:hypothetical protein
MTICKMMIGHESYVQCYDFPWPKHDTLNNQFSFILTKQTKSKNTIFLVGFFTKYEIINIRFIGLPYPMSL